jgi:hypothetical protein
MTRTRGSASKDLGRRDFGTAGGWKTPDGAPGWSGEVIGPGEGILRKPIVLSMPRPWKPRAGRIYNFPVRTIPDEK